jgi:hypothetical protein
MIPTTVLTHQTNNLPFISPAAAPLKEGSSLHGPENNLRPELPSTIAGRAVPEDMVGQFPDRVVACRGEQGEDGVHLRLKDGTRWLAVTNRTS